MILFERHGLNWNIFDPIHFRKLKIHFPFGIQYSDQMDWGRILNTNIALALNFTFGGIDWYAGYWQFGKVGSSQSEGSVENRESDWIFRTKDEILKIIEP